MSVLYGHAYITNGQKKQTLQIYYFFRIMRSFPKTGAESCYKRKLEYESILHNSTERLVGKTCREFENQSIIFSRKINSSIKHNFEVTVSVSYMYKLNDVY